MHYKELNIDNVGCGEAKAKINEAIATACEHIVSTQDNSGARVVTLKITLKPEKDKLNSIAVLVNNVCTVSLPPSKGMETCGAVIDGKVVFNEGDPQSQPVDGEPQTTIPRDGSTL